jgi:steroid delta-isomerase-like uncharacterized protein
MGAADVYDKVVDCFNRHDLDGLVALGADDAVLSNPGMGRGVYEGPAGRAEYFRMAWQAFPDMKMQVTRCVESGDELAVEAEWTGTHSGPLPLAGGETLPATGRRVQARMAVFSSLRNGKVVRSEFYHSGGSLDVLNQLGLVPAAASTG